MRREDVQRYGWHCYALGIAVGGGLAMLIGRWPSPWWLLAAFPVALGSFMFQKAGALRLTEKKGKRA